MISFDSRKDKLIRAMSAAGYTYDDIESRPDWVCFWGEFGEEPTFTSWDELEEWLNGVVFDDPEVAKKVWDIMHEEVSA